jgi:hypothetical protein
MNKLQIIALLEDGAYFDVLANKFFHPSFRKGWRKMKESNISWSAVENQFFGTKRLVCDDNLIYRLLPN